MSDPATDIDVDDDDADLEDAPGGHHLGDPIALHDLLALPPDGRRYVRDARGRLALMSPDSHEHHRTPIGHLDHLLQRRLDRPQYVVIPEPSVAFPRIYGQRGGLLPGSQHGPKSVEPDLVVFAGHPRRMDARDVTAPDAVLLVVEFLSAKTHRSDLGLGSRAKVEDVDLWRTYLESGVPEYWVVNVGLRRRRAIPPRSGLFLRNEGGAWRSLGGEGLVTAGSFRRLPAFGAGVVRSEAVPGLTLDLDAFWRDAAPS